MQSKSFAKLPSVASSEGLVRNEESFVRAAGGSSGLEAVDAFFACWRLGETKGEATMTENAIGSAD
jgi:hypothetical protein